MGGGDNAKVESTAKQLEAMRRNLPTLLKVYGDNILPYEQKALEARRVIEPQEMQMVLDNYRKYGKDFNAIGTESIVNNARDLATAENETLKGPGKELIAQALASDRQVDPEYYKTRESVSSGLNALLGNLSGTNESVQEEISRGLARSNPYDRSNTKLLANAMQFGNQGLQQQDMLSKALGQAAGALPQLKSGIDAFQIGTGRSAYNMNNPGANMIPQTNRALGSNTLSTGGNLLSNVNKDASNNAQLLDNAKKRQQDMIMEGIKGAAGLAGGLMAV